MDGLEYDIKRLKENYERLGNSFSHGALNDVVYKKWYLQQLNLIAARYKHLSGAESESALKVLHIERRKIENQIVPGKYTGRIKRWIFRIANAFTTKKEGKIFTQKQAEGLQSVLFQLKQAGLGKMVDQATKNIKNGTPEFSISVSEEVNKNQGMVINVRFVKDDNGKYKMHYKATLATYGGKTAKLRTIENGNEGLFTAEQSLNLLSGRSVKHHYFVEERQQSEWLAVDFNDVNANGSLRLKHYDTAVGYDLGKALDDLPGQERYIKDSKEAIIRKLENGNKVSVLLEENGKEIIVNISADPAGKGFTYYDGQGKEISAGKALGKEQTQNNRVRIAVQKPVRSKLRVV